MASEGVDARKSATKSETNTSDSWPTAETIGTGLAIIARATGSRLKAHKSSGDPPPRPTITKSTGGSPRLLATSGLESRRAAARPRTISSVARGPCTNTPITVRRNPGHRFSINRCMSASAAEPAPVMMAICLGRAGIGCLNLSSSPSFRNCSTSNRLVFSSSPSTLTGSIRSTLS